MTAADMCETDAAPAAAPSRRPLRAAVVALAALSAAAAASTYSASTSRDARSASSDVAAAGSVRRRLSEALPNGGCFVTPAVAAPPEIQPVIAASYPGSGARMTWTLIEALTGIVTGDDWNSNGWGKRVVSVKTHFPHPHGKQLSWEDEIQRAFVVIRNPLGAIPSFHNFLYEYENKLENHSTRAPVYEWIRWRDRNLRNEMDEWMNHIEYYLRLYPIDKRLVLPYEYLTDDRHGPRAAKDLARFLSLGPGVQAIAEESVPCVWGTVVKYQDGKQYNTRKPLDKNVEYVGSYPIWPSSSRKGDKERPYTQFQLEQAIEMLQELKIKYRNHDPNIRDIMQMYIDQIREIPADPRTAADIPPPPLKEMPPHVQKAIEDAQAGLANAPPPPQSVHDPGHAPGAPVAIAGVDGITHQPTSWNVGGGDVAPHGRKAEETTDMEALAPSYPELREQREAVPEAAPQVVYTEGLPLKAYQEGPPEHMYPQGTAMKPKKMYQSNMSPQALYKFLEKRPGP